LQQLPEPVFREWNGGLVSKPQLAMPGDEEVWKPESAGDTFQWRRSETLISVACHVLPSIENDIVWHIIHCSYYCLVCHIHPNVSLRVATS
jgi:hypothetical protein